MSTRDKRIARRLARALYIARHRPRVLLVQRPFPVGPNFLTHLSIGALVGEAVRHYIDYPTEDAQFFVQEFERRGLSETADVVRTGNDALGVDDSSVAAEPISVQQAFARLSAVGVADSTLNGLGAALDLADEDPWQDAYPTMMTSNEQIDDLIIVGADHASVAAYAQAVELSDVSPTDELADSAGVVVDEYVYEDQAVSETVPEATL